MNPNLLPNNSQEALGVRTPKNEFVSEAAQKRLAEVAPGIRNGKEALEITIANGAAALLQEHGRVAMQNSMANGQQQFEPTRQYEYRGQVAPQQRPGTIQSGQELQRKAVPAEFQQAPATPPPLDLQARIAQLQREATDQAQGKQDIVGQLGKAA